MLSKTQMAQITQTNNCWILSGDVINSTAGDILKASKLFNIVDNTSVDFADVEEIDTTAVSLILEWKRRAANENKSLTFVNLPENLTSLVKLYDVAELIS
jgi:phospholipid transport system transporter-binding protein